MCEKPSGCLAVAARDLAQDTTIPLDILGASYTLNKQNRHNF